MSDTEFTDKPVCPSCKQEQPEHFRGDWAEAGVTTCQSCGAPFAWERVQTVTYCTKAVQ